MDTLPLASCFIRAVDPNGRSSPALGMLLPFILDSHHEFSSPTVDPESRTDNHCENRSGSTTPRIGQGHQPLPDIWDAIGSSLAVRSDLDGLSTGQRCNAYRRQGTTKNDELASRHPRFAGKGDRSARWQVHPGDGTNRPPIPVKIDTVRNITLASRREGAAQRGDGVRARNAFAGHRHYELSSRQPQMAYRKFGRWRGRLNVER